VRMPCPKPKSKIAELLGISRQTLYDILAEKQPVTPGMALRLGKLLGNGPYVWINMQKKYDLYMAEQELKKRSPKFRRSSLLKVRQRTNRESRL
jgi:addiction module HigA family antidote